MLAGLERRLMAELRSILIDEFDFNLVRHSVHPCSEAYQRGQWGTFRVIQIVVTKLQTTAFS